MDLDMLKAILAYDPETGFLIWKRRTLRPGMERNDKGWNTRFVGKAAGRPHRNGHLLVNISYKNYSAHRLAWWMHYGEQPSGHIDHINGNPSDNRIANLRIATPSQNMRNARMRTDNKSGHKGVCWSERDKRWRAYMHVNGRMIDLGNFKTLEAAVEKRVQAAKKTFGEFYRET